jgi:chromosome segregation ATPase
MEEKINLILNKLDTMGNELKELKTDVKELKDKVNHLEEGQSRLEKGQKEIRSDIKELGHKVNDGHELILERVHKQGQLLNSATKSHSVKLRELEIRIENLEEVRA